MMEPVKAKGVSENLRELYYACKAAFTNCTAHVAGMKLNIFSLIVLWEKINMVMQTEIERRILQKTEEIK